MTKKHFIALADTVRQMKPYTPEREDFPFSDKLYFLGREAEWQVCQNALADFCASQNPSFNRKFWLAYIAGECGPNGKRR